MTLNFVCRGSRVSKKDGLTPLELYVIIDGKRSNKQDSSSTYEHFNEFMAKHLKKKKKVGLITHAVYVKYKCTIRYFHTFTLREAE